MSLSLRGIVKTLDRFHESKKRETSGPYAGRVIITIDEFCEILKAGCEAVGRPPHFDLTSLLGLEDDYDVF